MKTGYESDMLRQLYILEQDVADERGWVSRHMLSDEIGGLLMARDDVADALYELDKLCLVVQHRGDPDYWKLEPQFSLDLDEWGERVLEVLTRHPYWLFSYALEALMQEELRMEFEGCIIPTIFEHIKRTKGDIIEWQPYTDEARLSVGGWLKRCQAQAQSS